MSTAFKTKRSLFFYALLLGVLISCGLSQTRQTYAAPGINSQINFQGRLLNNQGATVADGNYNIEFKIYQDGDGQTAGDTTGSPAGTLKWTEDYLNTSSQGVTVRNGFLSVQLGSINPFGSQVNWNQSTLWLSVNIGGTGTCASFSACSPDGEMVPMKRLSANPYALNSSMLGGLTATQFLQIGQGVQTDATTVSSLFLNKTASGNIIELQASGTDAFTVGNAGDITFGLNANHTIAVTTAGAAVAGKSLTISAGGAGSGATALVGGNLVLQGGSGGGTNGNGGNVAIDAGVKNGTGTDGSISLGTNNASAITVGNTTITSGAVAIKAAGITQTLTGSATAPSAVIKTTTNSASAFQVQNSGGSQVLGVDTSNNLVALGQSSAVNGGLLFKNSTTANGITINSTNANSSYSLTLPAAAPAGGLCIETSTGNASQLIFASCSNNNANIQQVAEWDANNTNTLTVSPTTIGDEMVLTTQIPTSGVTVTGITGGGVSTWNKVVVNAGNGTVNRVEMWAGTVTTLGSSAITVTYSAAPGAEEVTATEFTASGVNASTSWGVESSAAVLNSAASTAVTFPSATAVNGSELYVGYAQVQNPPASAGTTTGFNYIVTSTQHNVITYNNSLTANTTYQPSANQTTAGQSNALEAVLTAFVTSTSINNATSLQKANFNVQAATAGSVAGILEAASSGTADILDLRNASGTNVASFGNTGISTFRNSADTSSSFQVQNAAGSNILSVNTTAATVTLGTASALSGSLTFNSSGSANSITLQAPTTVAASYSLSLPTNTPTAGLCLATSQSNANQLVFGSCATQVSAASISYVNRWGSSGAAVTTIADAPASTGNLLVFYSHTANNVSLTGISGGGVTNWTKVTSNANGTGQGNDEMWRGVVTTAGAGTITVTYSAAAGTNDIEAQEFTMGSSSGTWAVDTSGTAISSTSVTAINYPTLTPANSSELYTGYAWGQNAMSAGTTAGFTYQATTGNNYLAFNTNVTGGTAYTPSATQATAGAYNSIGAVIAAYAGTSVIVNSNAVQQANFNVQAATANSVAGVLQGASSGTADIFQAKSGSGTNVAAVNSSTGLTLGSSTLLTGQLNFATSGNNNIISIVAPSTPGASYTLTLPTTTPAAGQCLATSPNNANQLVFSSCANQVTSVAITNVNSWKTSGNGITTLPVSPAAVGNLMTFFSSPNSGATLASVSGGGVSTWTKVTGASNGSGSATSSIEMWRGQVTSAGASTITVTFNNPQGNPNELAAMEFTTGSSSGSWVVDASNAQYNSASSTTVNYPSLTPQSTKDLYVGYASAQATMSAGSTPGFTYVAGSQLGREGTYNTSVSTTTAPTATQATAGTSISVGALIAAYSSSSVISNSTVTQVANFNVQAATTGSVAGVLQAAAAGTGDALDILNGAGTLTDSFGSTGNFLLKPSTSSSSALQVQTAAGGNVFSIDTASKLVNIGAGSAGETSPSLLVLDNQTGSSADPSVLNGAMYYNATTHNFRCGVDGAWQNCTGLLYSNTSNSSANSNCTNNCVAFSTAASIPANYCQPGRVIKLSAAGYFSSAATTSNLQFGVYYGTDSGTAVNDTLLGTLPPAVAVTAANNNAFQMNFNIICFSTSSMQTAGILSVQAGAANAGMTNLPMSSTAATTVTSNTAKNLYIFPLWDTANASNTATVTQFAVNGL